MKIEQLWSELNLIYQHWQDGDFGNISKLSDPSVKLVEQRRSGISIDDAFSSLLIGGNPELKHTFYGDLDVVVIRQAETVLLKHGSNKFRVRFDANFQIDEVTQSQDMEEILMVTDFQLFTFYSFDKLSATQRPFITLQRKELIDHIFIAGSVWQFIFPRYYALISRTMSFAFPNSVNWSIFSNSKAIHNKVNFVLGKADEELIEENSALQHLNCFRAEHFNLVSLEGMKSEVITDECRPEQVDQYLESNFIFRRYSPKRSDIFNFGEPFQEMKRSDAVCTYQIGGVEFHRDFYFSGIDKSNLDRQLDVAAFDILHMLAIRRNSLFRTGFGKRVYNVMLPPALLISSSEPGASLALFPCLNLIRIPKQGIFRRTVSITFIAAPVSINETQTDINMMACARFLGELYDIKDEFLAQITEPYFNANNLANYRICGPLANLIKFEGVTTVKDICKKVAVKLMKGMFTANERPSLDTDSLINSAMFANNKESKLATMLLQISWNNPQGHTQPWERWLSEPEDRSFNNILFSTLFYRDFIAPFSAYSSIKALKMQYLNIGNTLGADMSGMTLYNPLEYMKLILFPKAFERYPNYSMLRWLTWQIYIDTALASLKALIEKFHTGLDDRHDLDYIIETLNDMVQEFVDLYDLDLTNHFYRKEYEKIRKLLNIDQDYEQLMSKFSSSKEDASLREQRLVNKLVFALAVTAVNVTIITTMATNDHWTSTSYMVSAILSSIIVSWAGFVFFDPIRKLAKKGYSRLFQLIK